MTLFEIFGLLALLLAAVFAYHVCCGHRLELVPCVACGMAQLGALAASGGHCATCHQRERIGEHVAQAVRSIRADADAAAWRR